MNKVKVTNQFGKTKDVKRGFSWTTLFFGAFVPFFRGDFKGFLVMFLINFILGWLTGGLLMLIGHVWFAVKYNEYYADGLTVKGYKVI